MPTDKIKYEVEFSCSAPDFWRFNLFMIVVGYDSAGVCVSFNDFTERIYELDYGGAARAQPVGYDKNRVARLVSGECAYAEVYLYAVANTLPASEVVRDTPSFPAKLKVVAGNVTVIDQEHTVNPWGGITIVAQRADAREVK